MRLRLPVRPDADEIRNQDNHSPQDIRLQLLPYSAGFLARRVSHVRVHQHGHRLHNGRRGCDRIINSQVISSFSPC